MSRLVRSGKMSLGSSPVRISAVANCRGHSMSQSERNSSVVLGSLAGCKYVNGLIEAHIRLMSSSFRGQRQQGQMAISHWEKTIIVCN